MPCGEIEGCMNLLGVKLNDGEKKCSFKGTGCNEEIVIASIFLWFTFALTEL